MSVATLVTRGYGSFGSVNKLPTRGYGIGAAIVVTTVATKLVGQVYCATSVAGNVYCATATAGQVEP